MEYYYGLIIVVIVLKVIIISIYCCVRAQRLNGCQSDRPRMVVVDGAAVAAATRARIERRNQTDRLAIVGQAEPMGTSPPPHLSVKRNHGPPSYEQATVDQNPNRQNRNPHGSFPQGQSARGPYRPEPNAHGSFPQGPSVRGPYPQESNVHGSFPLGPSASGPYPQDPNARRPFQQDPHARASYSGGPNAPAPYIQDPSALGVSHLDSDAQAPSAPYAPAAEPLPQNP